MPGRFQARILGRTNTQGLKLKENKVVPLYITSANAETTNAKSSLITNLNRICRDSQSFGVSNTMGRFRAHTISRQEGVIPSMLWSDLFFPVKRERFNADA